MGKLPVSPEERVLVEENWVQKYAHTSDTNGTVYASEVSEDGMQVKLWETDYAHRQARGLERDGVQVSTFQEVNYTCFGDSGDFWVVGRHHTVGLSPFGGILDVPDLLEHVAREVHEESGLNFIEPCIMGIVRRTKCVNFIVKFNTPSREECLHLWEQRTDDEMCELVFVPKSHKGIKDTFTGQPQWSFMRPILEHDLS